MVYEFILEGIYIVEIEWFELDYIYFGQGIYVVQVRVKDNDGVWLELVWQQFVV